MSIRLILTSVLSAAVLLAGRAPGAESAVAAPEAAPPAAAPPPTAPAPSPGTAPLALQGGGAEQFVQNLYAPLGRGVKDAHLPLADAIHAEALLERVLAGLSAQPPADWRAAAQARLENGREAMAKQFARMVVGSMVRALPAQPGPDGTTRVAVRLYIFREGGSFQTGWHRLTLRSTGANWRIADIEMLDSGDQLSNVALITLYDSEQATLPSGSAVSTLTVPAVELVVCVALGVVVGLVLRSVLAKRRAGASAGGKGTTCVLLASLAGAALGLILFGVGMVRFLGESGGIAELRQRARSFALLQAGNEAPDVRILMARIDGALKAWSGNRTAQIMRAGLIATQAGPEEAEGYLAAMAQTESPPPAVYLHLARLQEQAKRWPEAAANRRKFSEVLGGDALAWTEAARDLARGQDVKGAEELLRAAEKAEAPDFRILMVRAEAHAAAKQGAAVVADFKALLALPERILDPREAAAILEQSEDYRPVRDNALVKAYVKELKGGAAEEPQLGPVRR